MILSYLLRGTSIGKVASVLQQGWYGSYIGMLSSPENYIVLSASLFTFEILVPRSSSWSVLSAQLTLCGTICTYVEKKATLFCSMYAFE